VASWIIGGEFKMVKVPFSASIALLLVRIVLAVTFIYHGGQKLFGWFGGPGMKGFETFLASMHLPILPSVTWAFIAAIAECIGGFALLPGFLSRFWACGLVIDMLVAIYVRRHADVTGTELEQALLVLAAVVVLSGPGIISIDALLFRRPLWPNSRHVGTPA
jgi:putative oxidoreductase